MKEPIFEIDKDNTLLGIYKIPKGTTKLIIPKGVKKIKRATDGDEYIDDIKEIIIPEDVEIIGTHAFLDFPNVETLILPSTLKTIDNYSFIRCNIKEVSLNEGLILLGYAAFRECNIEKLSINSKDVKTLEYAFDRTTISKEININKDNPVYSDMNSNVIYNKEKNMLIKGCDNSIIPETTKIISFEAFANTNIDKINLPKNIEKIEEHAFQASSLKQIEFNEKILEIERGAFSETKISELILPSSLIKIGVCAFASCDELKKVNCHCNIKAIDETAFKYCDNLETIYADNINNVDKRIKFYKKYKDKISNFTLDILIDENRSIKEINKFFKGQER